MNLVGLIDMGVGVIREHLKMSTCSQWWKWNEWELLSLLKASLSTMISPIVGDKRRWTNLTHNMFCIHFLNLGMDFSATKSFFLQKKYYHSLNHVWESTVIIAATLMWPLLIYDWRDEANSTRDWKGKQHYHLTCRSDCVCIIRKKR